MLQRGYLQRRSGACTGTGRLGTPCWCLRLLHDKSELLGLLDTSVGGSEGLHLEIHRFCMGAFTSVVSGTAPGGMGLGLY